jgi:hypothetical protein
VKKVPAEKDKTAHKGEPAASAPRLLDPASTVESVVTSALTSSTHKMGLGDTKAFVTCLRKCDCMAVSYYSHDVAKELGKVLGSWSKSVRAVYACNYDDGTSGECCLGGNTATLTLIHMIIWAEKKNKALNALLDALDSAMVQQHRRLLGLSRLKHVLDAQVIDDEDVKNRTGYAVLLRSIHQPPIQVWRNGR